MHLHFYASLIAINSINNGQEMIVRNKEARSSDDVHVSFDTNLYTVTKVVESRHLFKVKKIY